MPCWLLFCCAVFATLPSLEERRLPSLYNSLNNSSIAEQLTFYELYPDSPEGKKALKRAWELLSGGTLPSHTAHLMLPQFELSGIIALVNKQPFSSPVTLDEQQLELIEKMGSRLSNRSLKGHAITSPNELLPLPSNEVDLARGLFIEQFGTDPDFLDKTRQYEAHLDLMALQILARLPKEATDLEKLAEMNRFIFHEMQFRFPPHSLYAKEIDLYTFLPSVLDSRRGVCLGVSILYLCLGQRLNLPLEIVTPPGHIYVRYRTEDQIINIETTARGIDTPSELYLGINTRKLQQRNIKEVIGMAFFNQASVSWSQGDFNTTIALYEKARPYLQDDPLLNMLLGFNYLFTGKEKEGRSLLTPLKKVTFEESVSQETIPDDYLSGKVDAEGIKAVFMPVDESRESICAKQKEIEAILSTYPKYRAGLMHLATTWLQLGRMQEAQEVLLRYHRLDPNNATVEYYLAMLAAQRMDYPMAWLHLKQTETLVMQRHHYPRALADLREQLSQQCPEGDPV